MSDAYEALGKIKARAENATSGPWEADKTARVTGPGDAPWGHEVLGCADCSNWPRKPDAEFIAHARTDVPRLVATVESVLDYCDGVIAGDWVDDGELIQAEHVRDIITNKMAEECVGRLHAEHGSAIQQDGTLSYVARSQPIMRGSARRAASREKR